MPPIALPDEIWRDLLDALPGARRGMCTSVRLLSGTVIHDMIISNRGFILGRDANGLAGAHGMIDDSMLTFRETDIEAVSIPAFHFWQRQKWIALDPNHPARRKKADETQSA